MIVNDKQYAVVILKDLGGFVGCKTCPHYKQGPGQPARCDGPKPAPCQVRARELGVSLNRITFVEVNRHE